MISHLASIQQHIGHLPITDLSRGIGPASSFCAKGRELEWISSLCVLSSDTQDKHFFNGIVGRLQHEIGEGTTAMTIRDELDDRIENPKVYGE
jgi:hypothetical protein